MVNGMLGLILCNGIVHIVSSSLQINIFWMRMQRAWKWIVWQEWPHTLALLPIWYKEQWKEYYSHVKLATPFLLFCEFFSILPYIYIYLFLLLFSALHHCCFVKLSHNFLTCPKVNPAGSIQLPFPPFPSSFPFCEAPQTAGPAPHSSVIQHLQTEQRWAWSSPHSTQPASSRKGLTARKCRPAATRPLWWQGEGNWGLCGVQIGICSTLVPWARVHS